MARALRFPISTLPGLAFAALGASCVFTFPDYELAESGSTTASTSGGGGMGGSGGETPAPFAMNGDSCGFDWECFSGNCLPNNTEPGSICCANACPDMGEATCGTNGKCDAGGADCALYPAGKYCGATTCDDGMITIRQCLAGSCTPSAPIPCAGGLACSADGAACKEACLSDDDCANPQLANPSPECDAGGECVERPPGAECSDDSQCASNRCGTTGTGHCCRVSCGSGDESCAALDCDASGECAFPAAGTPCGPQSCQGANLTTQRCDGAGSCTWESTQQCSGHLRCEGPVSCYATCGSNDATGDQRCAPGHWCDGSTCYPATWDDGPCLRDGQCRTKDCTPAGFCTPEDSCDADKDGQRRDDPLCGGKDCDDSDGRVMFGQSDFFDTPRASGGYDFDCNGAEQGNHATSCYCVGQKLAVPAGGAGCSVSGQLLNCVGIFPVCWESGAGSAKQLCH